MISKEYRNAAEANNAKLFKAVNLRLANVLVRAQADGFIEGFSSQTKKGTGLKSRHTAFRVQGPNFQERHQGRADAKGADFSLYVSAGTTGPVSVEFYSVGHKARDLLTKIIGEDRRAEFKGPHIVEDVTSASFKRTLNMLEGMISRTGAKLHANPPQKAAEPVSRL